MMNAVGIDVSKGKSTVTIRRPGDEVILPPYYYIFMVNIPNIQLGCYPSCCLSCRMMEAIGLAYFS